MNPGRLVWAPYIGRTSGGQRPLCPPAGKTGTRASAVRIDWRRRARPINLRPGFGVSQTGAWVMGSIVGWSLGIGASVAGLVVVAALKLQNTDLAYVHMAIAAAVGFCIALAAVRE